MAGSSTLRSLNDADLEAIHHLIRRDELSDLQIALEAEKRGARMPVAATSRSMVISRYRKSPVYRKWLDRWENQDVKLKAAVELQKSRFEYLSTLVSQDAEGGIYAASNHLKARLLLIASEMSDDELKTSDIKWLPKLLAEIRGDERMKRQTLGEKAAETAADPQLTPEERAARVREIFEVKQ